MRFLRSLVVLAGLAVLSSCGGGGSGGGVTGSANVGGGYTLLVSGGTYNDGSGTNGLAVLATLRDSHGYGPGLSGNWQITITGPGLPQPLTESYDDASASSYKSWWWEGLNPGSGTYTATATNGTTTLTYYFNISASSLLLQPLLSYDGSKISWNAVTGAGSYYYEVTDGYGFTAQSGYLNGGSSSYSFQLDSSKLIDGSYSVAVYAQTKSRIDLGDPSVALVLPSQDNISVSTIDIVISGGAAGSYKLSAAGGTLYMGQKNGQPQYGLVIWTSILANGSTPPASDWTIKVTGPGISTTTPIVFTYPQTDSHYVYWDFGTTPASGTYTVAATIPGSGNAPIYAQFTIDTTQQIPVTTGIGIGVTPGSNNYTASWYAVTGANSYYVNVWADVWNAALARYEYTEVANAWVNGSTLTANIPKISLTKGTAYDLYVTACTLDMTTMKTAVPNPLPTQVNMSDNTYAPVSFTAQ